MTIIRKHSKKRDAILEVIQSTTSHPSAQWVYEQLKPRISDLSLGTVYRNLKFFVQEGRIITVGVVDGEERFDGVVQPHPHFVCDHCGTVIDLPFTVIEQLDATQNSDCRLRIDYRKTVFHGTCSACAN